MIETIISRIAICILIIADVFVIVYAIKLVNAVDKILEEERMK